MWQATDANVTAAVDLRHVLRPRTAFDIQPFPSLVWGFNFASGRDLVDPALRTTTNAGREELENASGKFLGMDVGWETDRAVTTNLAWQPRLASWFDTRFNLSTGYNTFRSVAYIQDLQGDTTLVRDLSMSRDLGFEFDVRPDAILTAFGLPVGGTATGAAGSLRAFWDRLSPIRIDWRRALSSSYDRRNISTNIWDQLVLVSFDNMRIMGADTASAAGNIRNWSIGGGYRFPHGLDFSIDYVSGDRSTITALNEQLITEREWPSLELRWRQVPIPSAVQGALRDITVTGEWRTTEITTSTTTGQDRGNEQTRRGAGLTFVFTNGFTLTYDFANTASERLDATGLSQTDRSSHSVRLSGFVPPPGFLTFVKNDVRIAAEYTSNGNTDCRALGGSGFGEVSQQFRDDCTTHTDQTTQNAGLTVDTDFTGYSIGLQLSWVGRSSTVGRQQTSNQFNFNIFGRFYLRASEGQTQFSP